MKPFWETLVEPFWETLVQPFWDNVVLPFLESFLETLAEPFQEIWEPRMEFLVSHLVPVLQLQSFSLI